MEKIKSEGNTIHSLYDKNGIQQCETSQVLKITEDYYSDLFRAGKTNKLYQSEILNKTKGGLPRPSWSFKQRQLNQAIMITLRPTEHANIFLNTYPVVVFGHLSLQPLFPCTRSQQCFTTVTIRSFGHFEHLELPLLLYSDMAFTRCE